MQVLKILEFLALTERLKKELQHSWLSDGRRESVAEHSYQMALMAVLCAPYLSVPVNLLAALKLILFHDVVEAIAGDIPYFETSERKQNKRKAEEAAIKQLSEILPEPLASELVKHWYEFEDGDSPEAKLARALDHLEVQLQHNLADLATWEPVEHELLYTKMTKRCEHDPFLVEFCSAIRCAGEQKLRDAGIDVDEIKRKLGAR